MRNNYCPYYFDLEEVDKQSEVLSILLSRMCQDRFWTRKAIHVDLETVETERNIVHIHEDLRVKSTVRA